MCDADGATKFSDLERLESRIKKAEKKGLGIAVGSRHLMQEKDDAKAQVQPPPKKKGKKWIWIDQLEFEKTNKMMSDSMSLSLSLSLFLCGATQQRTLFRKILMRGFHLLVMLCVADVKDTQCGFKLFTRRAAQLLAPNLHIERWAFDVELLFLAQQFGIPIAEVPVNWQEIAGSTLNPLTASLQMAKDIFYIRTLYLFRIWTVKKWKEGGGDVCDVTQMAVEW